MRAAYIIDGAVYQYTEVDVFMPPTFIDPLDSDIGWLWDGHVFTAPPYTPPPVPAQVGAYGLEVVMQNAGVLETWNEYLALHPMQEIKWRRFNSFNRNDPLINVNLRAALSYSTTQIDDLYLSVVPY